MVPISTTLATPLKLCEERIEDHERRRHVRRLQEVVKILRVAFDEEAAVKELDGRMTKLEGQMNDLLTTIKDGFETMEASQEVAFRAFYNAQKRQRANGSPSKFGSPKRGE